MKVNTNLLLSKLGAMALSLTLAGALFLFVGNFVTVNAIVSINEISSFDSSGDWVELYSDEDIDLNGYRLTHLKNNATEEANIKLFNASTLIGPGTNSFFIVSASNLLDKEGDWVRLYAPSSTEPISSIMYGEKGGPCAPLSGQSIGSYPSDGMNNVERFDRFSSWTKESSNSTATLFPCPPPTPDPPETFTPTPKPTSTPKPTATSKPTQTATKTPSPKPTTKATETSTVSPSETLTEEESNDSTSVLAASIQNESDSATPADDETKDSVSTKTFPKGAIAMVVGGLFFLGASVYALRYGKNNEPKDDEIT